MDNLPTCKCGGHAYWVILAPDPTEEEQEPTRHRIECPKCGEYTNWHQQAKSALKEWSEK